MQVQVFCDFDGTAAVNDVGQALFNTFADREACDRAVALWMRNEISSAEMYRRECETLCLTRQELNAFAATQSLDVHFPAFAERCRESGVDLHLLSDGFRPYIAAILSRYNLEDMHVLANEMLFQDTNRIEPAFPHLAESCGACANCKGFHVRSLKRSGVLSVFIGNGYSDRCGAVEADVVFAKDDLESYCKLEKVTYHPFRTFADVISKFEKSAYFR